ncbi:MAG: hypothetical protein M0021_07635 [Clostridia bacterium]|nr:hypothetical protein [Clostridia bacterium]
MAVNKEWFPILPGKFRKEKEVPQSQEKPHLQVLHKEEVAHKQEVAVTTTTHSAVTVFYWCRVCQQKHPASECKSCDCGVTMCNSCWNEWEIICPICETDLR